MTEQQFEEIVEAILAGKYSWGCVLILQAAGYNPLHYIPYRTYNRLVKNNYLEKRKERQQNKVARHQERSHTKSSDIHSEHLSRKIENMSYLDKISNKESKISGGWRFQWNFSI